MKNALGLAALGEAGMGVILLAYPPIVVRPLFASRSDYCCGQASSSTRSWSFF